MKKSEPKPTRAKMRAFTEKLLTGEVRELSSRLRRLARNIAWHERSGTIVDGKFYRYEYAARELRAQRTVRTKVTKRLALAQAALAEFTQKRR